VAFVGGRGRRRMAAIVEEPRVFSMTKDHSPEDKPWLFYPTWGKGIPSLQVLEVPGNYSYSKH